MSETKNVVIQQNNGTDYNILYPDSNSWKKDQVAVLETFQKYGLDANAIPKDLFDYLIGQMKTEYGKTYWWKKWKWNFNINRNEPDPNGKVVTNIPDGSTVYFAQFSSVQAVRDGTYIGTPIQILSKRRSDYFQFPLDIIIVLFSKLVKRQKTLLLFVIVDIIQRGTQILQWEQFGIRVRI